MNRRRFIPLALLAPSLPAVAQAQPQVSVRVEGIAGEDRVPLSQVPVTLLRLRPSMNLPFPLPVRSEISARDGWAHFFTLDPGVYSIQVRTVVPGDGKEGWLPQYAGGAPTWRTAETFTVRASGPPLEFRFVLQRGQPWRLTGKAVDEEGRPAAGAALSLSREDQPVPPVASATARTDGSFDFGFVFPDRFRIRGEWQGQSADESFLLPAEGTAPPTIRMERTFPLEGRLKGKDVLSALPRISGLRMHALPESGAIFNEATTPVQQDGTFAFSALSPGRYLLQPSFEPPGFYLQRMLLAGVDVLGETVDLHRGYGPLEVEFEPGPGSVAGAVEDASRGAAEPAPAGSIVALVNSDPKRRHFLLFIKSSQVGEKGGFSIDGVAPGEYLAWAFDRLETRDLSDSLLVERLKNFAETVKVTKGQTATVNLKLLSWDMAAGT